jgi:hypothetical protein
MSLILLAVAFVGGAVVGAGGWAAIKAKAVAELKVLAADVKTEAAKVVPVGHVLLSKVEALIAKL